MAVRTHVLFDTLRLRKNPHDFLSSITPMEPGDLRKIARAVANLEHEIYKDTEVYENGMSTFLEDFNTQGGLKYSAVLYDTENGGTRLGPYIGYLVAYEVDKDDEEIDDMIDEAESVLGRQKARELKQTLLSHTGPVVYVSDVVRVKTEKAKAEFGKMLTEFVEKIKAENAIVIATMREATSYKVLKRFEQMGVCEVLAEVPDDDYYDDETVYHVAARLRR